MRRILRAVHDRFGFAHNAMFSAAIMAGKLNVPPFSCFEVLFRVKLALMGVVE